MDKYNLYYLNVSFDDGLISEVEYINLSFWLCFISIFSSGFHIIMDAKWHPQ